MNTITKPLRELQTGDMLNDGSGRAPNDRLNVYVNPQHIGHDVWILDVEDCTGHKTAFPPLSGGTKCQVEVRG